MNPYQENVPRMRFPRFFIFLLFAPTILFGILLYFDFNDYQIPNEEVDQLQSIINEMEWNNEVGLDMETTNFYILPNGNSLAAVDTSEGLVLQEWDPSTAEIVASTPINTIIFNDIIHRYQNEGIMMLTATPDRESKHQYYESGKGLEILDFPTIVDTPFIEQISLVYDQTLYTVGQNADGEFMINIVKDGEVDTVNLSAMPEFSMLVDADFNNPGTSISGTYLPIVQLRMYDNETAYIVLAADQNGNYPVIRDYSIIGDQTAMLYAPFFDASTPYIHVYTNQLHLSSIDYSITRMKMETPNEVFYPQVFYLDPEHVAVIGHSSINEKGPPLGYIYDPTGTELRYDLTPFIAENPTLFTDMDASNFQLQLHDGTLYTTSEIQAHALDLTAGRSIAHADADSLNKAMVGLQTKLQAQVEEAHQADHENTSEKFKHFIEHSPIAKQYAVFWIGSTAIVAVILMIPFLIVRRRHKNIQRAYDNGGDIVQAIIHDVEQTGVYINEQPQVKVLVSFKFNNMEYERTARFTTNLIDPVRVGDTVEFLFDPVIDRLYHQK